MGFVEFESLQRFAAETLANAGQDEFTQFGYVIGPVAAASVLLDRESLAGLFLTRRRGTRALLFNWMAALTFFVCFIRLLAIQSRGETVLAEVRVS